jgi:hypothetical protein
LSYQIIVPGAAAVANKFSILGPSIRQKLCAAVPVGFSGSVTVTVTIKRSVPSQVPLEFAA